MKLAPPRAATADPRAIPLPLAIDEQGLAQRIQDAPSADEAWRRLGFAGGRQDVDPAVLERLLASVTTACAVSDAIGSGFAHIGALAPGEAVPDAWIDRMVELFRQDLEAFWALDDLAYAGLEAGGWTAATREPYLLTAVGRVIQRVLWVVQPISPPRPELWFDRLIHGLEAQIDPLEARRLGLHLIGLAVRKHCGRIGR